MRLKQYLNERIINIEKLDKIKQVFFSLPKNNTPEAVADYIVKTLQVLGISYEGGGYTYLSGPMTNLPDDNWPVFIYAEDYISGKVINPAKPHGKIIKKAKKDFTWIDYMIEDVYDLVKCNKIILLPGYSKSTGAKVEIFIGKHLVGVKPVEFKKILSKPKFEEYIEKVKSQYLKDGFDKEYYSIIEPMLKSKSEDEAAKFVRTFNPTESIDINENIIKNTINNLLLSVKKITLKEALRIIGLILNTIGIRRFIR